MSMCAQAVSALEGAACLLRIAAFEGAVAQRQHLFGFLRLLALLGRFFL